MNTSIKITALSIILLLAACGEKKTSTDFKTTNAAGPETEVFKDSAAQIQSEISELKMIRETKLESSLRLSRQRDSISAMLQRVTNTMQQVSDKKINPGIVGVHTKLDELKGQKENLEEQGTLQKQELALAEKKIELLNEEKVIYDAQRKALYDKGAKPEDFVGVDSLLDGIQNRISKQVGLIKFLKQSITDSDEQQRIIAIQRGSLSSKIRDNYTAQQILDEFSNDEKTRLEAQLVEIDAALAAVLNDESQVKTALAINNNKIAHIEQTINANKVLLNNEKEALKRNQDLKEQQKKAQKESRVQMAFASIGGLALLLIVLFMLGKRRKKRKQEYGN